MLMISCLMAGGLSFCVTGATDSFWWGTAALFAAGVVQFCVWDVVDAIKELSA